MAYKVQLEVFEGPLDLLLYLIKKEEIDIYDIPIAKITEQYLEYIRLMKMLNLDIAGEFLVMAATLMHIKSKMLLPEEKLEIEEEIEDPRKALVNKLLEYKRFKDIADGLEERERMQGELFTRSIAHEEVSEEEPLLEVSLFDLMSVFSDLLKVVKEEGYTEIVKDETTVKEKIRQILDMLRPEKAINFTKLFIGVVSKAELIVTFLALLELMRLKEVKVRQRKRFGQIMVYRGEGNL